MIKIEAIISMLRAKQYLSYVEGLEKRQMLCFMLKFLYLRVGYLHTLLNITLEILKLQLTIIIQPNT